MSSTHLCRNYHLIFSTHDRYRWIDKSWEDRLHSYIGGILRDLHGVAKQIGGDMDHIHILASLNATHRLSDIMRDIKAGSSKWIHETLGKRSFNWQDGYGAFTVSPSDIDGVRQYIQGQKEHHRKKTFQ
jgi:putative transposase